MSVIGYARVSTSDQDCAIQEAALRDAGCDTIRSERKSGTTTKGRSELATVLDFLRPGDTLMVTRIDRLARSLYDLEGLVRVLTEKGVHLKALQQPVDTSSAAGKAFLSMLGVFAEFETNLRKERQAEGIAKAKAEGIYKGGKQRIDRSAAKALYREGLGATEMAKRLSCSRMQAHRLIKEFAEA